MLSGISEVSGVDERLLSEGGGVQSFGSLDISGCSTYPADIAISGTSCGTGCRIDFNSTEDREVETPLSLEYGDDREVTLDGGDVSALWSTRTSSEVHEDGVHEVIVGEDSSVLMTVCDDSGS